MISETKGKYHSSYIVDNFGLINFAEINSLSLKGFGYSLKKFFKNGDNRPKAHYNPGEIENQWMEDFSEGLKLFFDRTF